MKVNLKHQTNVKIIFKMCDWNWSRAHHYPSQYNLLSDTRSKIHTFEQPTRHISTKGWVLEGLQKSWALCTVHSALCTSSSKTPLNVDVEINERQRQLQLQHSHGSLSYLLSAGVCCFHTILQIWHTHTRHCSLGARLLHTKDLCHILKWTECIKCGNLKFDL